MPGESSLLEMKNITKTFPGVVALDDVNLVVNHREVHALVGENGAGKSTLVKVLSGVYPFGTYSGDIILDGILSPYDPISLACLEACKAVGYGTTAGKPLPIVGGQDCIVASCKSILAGEQYATILKDTRSLGAATVELVDMIMQGIEPEGLDMTSYHNGVIIVPSLLLDSVIITKDNLIEMVVDTGYHTAEELGL